MHITNPKVDWFFNKTTQWQAEYALLRTIVLDCGVTEELKWGCPCYIINKSNIVLIHGFKEYCALLFMQGALLKDTNGILIQQTENVQAARQIRFTHAKEITQLKPVLKAYIHEAIAIQKAGLKVELKKPEAFKMAQEFQDKLTGKEGAKLKAAFEALTPGRQRAYLLHFSAPKLATTRATRVAKSIPHILNGKGLNDEYEHKS